MRDAADVEALGEGRGPPTTGRGRGRAVLPAGEILLRAGGARDGDDVVG